jgi:fermentation-respiration switch protein FrsA (DUF1100 family)
MRVLRCTLLVLVVSLWSVAAQAGPIALDFESLADGEDVTTQFLTNGVTFTGAMALLAGANGGSLNDLEFPPASGAVVLFDSAPGGMRIDFLDPVSSVAGFFTYAAPVTLTAYSGLTVVGSVTSAFGANTFFTGNPTNELLQFVYEDGITAITLMGDPLGGSFALDNLTAQAAEATVPEPGAVCLLMTGAAMVVARRRRLLQS